MSLAAVLSSDRRGIFAASAAVTGLFLQYNYNTGLAILPQEKVEDYLYQAYNKQFRNDTNFTVIRRIYFVIVHIFSVGFLIGAVLIASVADRFGRRGGLLFNNFILFVASVLMGFSKTCQSYEMLVFGRLLFGINAGLNAGLIPMYVTEISPVNKRGVIGVFYQWVMALIVLQSTTELLKETKKWDQIKIISFRDDNLLTVVFIIFPVVYVSIGLLLCSESPRHVLMNQRRDEDARKALTWFRLTTEVDQEMDEMRAENEFMKSMPTVTLRELFSNPALRQPMVISIVVMLSQQWCGINAIRYFSVAIFKKAGLDYEYIGYYSFSLEFVIIIVMAISMLLIDRVGRRMLLLVGFGGMTVATAFLTISLMIKESEHFFSYISVVAIYVFVIMFALGPVSIPWFLVAELFPTRPRAIATSVAVSANWAASFIVGIVFPPLQMFLAGNVFFIFIVLVFFCFYIFKKVPETKGKTAVEISAIFRPPAYV